MDVVFYFVATGARPASRTPFRLLSLGYPSLEEEGKTVNGQGADTDTLVASCKAYLHALNKLLVKRQKTAPAALSA